MEHKGIKAGKGLVYRVLRVGKVKTVFKVVKDHKAIKVM